LVALVVIGVGAVAFRTLRGPGKQAIPRVEDVARLYVYLNLPVDPPIGPLPPPFDAPPAHFATLLGHMNTATEISLPQTKVTVGYLEAWYRDGAGLRAELYLVASNSMSIESKDLVLATPDGVWRRSGKFVDFIDDVKRAFQATPAQTKSP
jgi:hypothetical protein